MEPDIFFSGNSIYGTNQFTHDKQPMKCTYCNQENHTRETCFKLNGYPKKKKKGKPYTSTTNFRQLPKAIQVNVDTRDDNSTTSQSNIQLENLQSQVSQMSHMMNIMFSHKGLKTPEDHVAGIITVFSSIQTNIASSWIIDTGATDHMCSHKHLMSNLRSLNYPVHISIPNGNFLKVTHIGSVVLSPTLTLQNVLFVPNFHYNLLSVSKLT